MASILHRTDDLISSPLLSPASCPSFPSSHPYPQKKELSYAIAVPSTAHQKMLLLVDCSLIEHNFSYL